MDPHVRHQRSDGIHGFYELNRRASELAYPVAQFSRHMNVDARSVGGALQPSVAVRHSKKVAAGTAVGFAGTHWISRISP